jgi:hypothetical protein
VNQLDLELPQVHLRPLGPVELPAAQPMAPALLQSQLAQALHALESAVPALEVAHSLHHEALQDPAVAGLEAMHRFTEASVSHLHTAVAAAGYIRRVLSGDRTAAVWNGLQSQLGALHPTHNDAQSALTQVMASAEARANAAVQSLSQVMTVVDQAHRSLLTAIRPLLSVEMH